MTMSDLYIVTVEDAQDGTFFEDPEGFDNAWQAKEYAAKQAIPNGHVVAVYATLEWVQALRKEASLQIGAFALFMFLTGARPSEAMEADIDLPNATAKIHASKVGHERNVHLPEMLVAALANIPAVKGRSLFFYTGRNSVYTPWYAAIERAKIKEMSPHCCRHGFITGLLRSGIDVKTVEWLADVTAETLLKTYAHAIKDRRLTNVLTDTSVTQQTIENARNPRKTGTT